MERLPKPEDYEKGEDHPKKKKRKKVCRGKKRERCRGKKHKNLRQRGKDGGGRTAIKTANGCLREGQNSRQNEDGGDKSKTEKKKRPAPHRRRSQKTTSKHERANR